MADDAAALAPAIPRLAGLAAQVLGWTPQTTLEQLCQMMVDADLARNQRGASF